MGLYFPCAWCGSESPAVVKAGGQMIGEQPSAITFIFPKPLGQVENVVDLQLVLSLSSVSQVRLLYPISTLLLEMENNILFS